MRRLPFVRDPMDAPSSTAKTARHGKLALALSRQPPVPASRRDVAASIVLRYVIAIVAGFHFYLLRDRLPFPHPELSILCAVTLAYNTLLVPALFLADRLPLRPFYLVVACGDMAVAFGFVHLTGGYLSPFLVCPLLTAIGFHIAYLTARRAGVVTLACLSGGLVGMTLAHRMEWAPCPVPYAAQLIHDDAFFYATFPPVLLLFTLGWVLVRNTGGSVYATITDLLGTNQQLVERMAAHSQPQAWTEFLQLVAASFGGDRAFLVPLPDRGCAPLIAQTWPVGSWCEPLEALSETEPARRALSEGVCLVPYGASKVFPSCPMIRETETNGCWITVLRDEKSEPIGLMGVLRRGPLRLDHKAEFLMKLFTVLGQTALQHRLTEQATSVMREQLHHARKMEALGQLAGGVAHDFNNLLAIILGASELLGVSLKELPHLAGYARDIQAAGWRAADLVRHLLSFARRVPLGTSPIDLHASLAEVRRLLAHTLDKRIELALELSAPCATVLGDASQIQNALLNVALNARDAMPDGGTLEFSTRTLELGVADLGPHARVEPGTFVEVRCRDTGVGMPPEVLERAFDPFFTTKGPGKGTGLGLAAVYGCVQAHGGFVEVESTVGVGTCLRIVLPTAHVSVEPPGAARVVPPVALSVARLLLAEDEEQVAAVMAIALRKAGYEVDVCPDGLAALERYRENPSSYALVLLDVMMPRLDGRQVFDALQELTPGFRCIFVSGHSEEGSIGGLLAEGRCGFVQKPFVLAQLLDAVRSELDGTRG